MKMDGIVASDVSVIPDKGVGFQVMVMELGLTLNCFVPQEKLTGEGKFKMGDNVIADMRRPYPSGRDVRFNIESIKLNNDHIPKAHKP